ncbi:hypothetical protein D9757_009676 [Collybiopsis confluens]|uniref:Integral membrane protein n=1 Tax=Collybiopsis confluens TaxID=2823264 RepID=A0A8H5H246_9AGAR|nr:hypothetical protein D9757_009676 [Collybiopsis confluens]
MASALVRTVLLVLFICCTPINVAAHAHHDELSEEDASKPVDAILWIHIFLQAIIWGLLFPVGMVFGLSRSRWHVPLQSTGIALTLGGYFLGHAHKGRAFLAGVHGTMANILLIPILTQLVVGIYLKLHIHERSLRPWAVRLHGLVGKSYPILGWTQMLFGAITFRGYCRGGSLGQCLAHYIMGSGFIAYGTIMAILLLVGEAWVRRSGRSPEWWDSWVIMLWGIVNTFTEHRGSHWSAKDMQHTILGVLWWTGGALGIFLARKNQRTVVPAIIIILTGWAMSEHAQALMISTRVHALFGYTLGLAGVTRIIEICFFVPTFAQSGSSHSVVPDDSSDHTLASPREQFAPTLDNGMREAKEEKTAAAKVFRHLPPYLLVTAGLLFISATDEELDYASLSARTVWSKLEELIPTSSHSISFVLYLLIVFLINLYATSGRNASATSSAFTHERQHRGEYDDAAGGGIELRTPLSAHGHEHGQGAAKWYARVPSRSQAVDGRAAEQQHILGEDEDEE